MAKKGFGNLDATGGRKGVKDERKTRKKKNAEQSTHVTQ